MLASLISESGTVRFMGCYQSWCELLAVAYRGSPAAPPPSAVRHAASIALLQLYRRVANLLEVPGIRREASQLSGKVIPTLLSELEGDVLAKPSSLVALQLAGTILRVLPSTWRPHAKALETILISCVFGTVSVESESVGVLAARVLALLPLAQGEAEGWSSLCLRLLASAHHITNELYAGADLDASMKTTLESLLTVQGGTWTDHSLLPKGPRPAPPALGRCLVALEALLTGSFPHAIPFPSAALAVLCSRLVSLQPARATGAALQPQIDGTLPLVQAAALGLLTSVLRTGGAALTPLFASLRRVLGDKLRVAAAREMQFAASPLAECVRRELYEATGALVDVGGGPLARSLADLVLLAARAELYYSTGAGVDTGAGAVAASLRDAAGSKGAKRKKAGAEPLLSLEALGLEGPAASAGSLPEAAMEALSQALANEALGTRASHEAFSAQCSALALLEAVLRKGADLIPTEVRAVADATAAQFAGTAARAAQALMRAGYQPTRAALRALQLASYSLLLTSVLTPAPHRPRFLPLAVRLFSAGQSDPAPEVAALCGRALTALGPLLRPRDLPLALHPGGAATGILPRLQADIERETEAAKGLAALPFPKFWFQAAPAPEVREISTVISDAVPSSTAAAAVTAVTAPATAEQRQLAASTSVPVVAAPTSAAVPLLKSLKAAPAPAAPAKATPAPISNLFGAGSRPAPGGAAGTKETATAAAVAPAAVVEPAPRLQLRDERGEEDEEDNASLPSIDSGDEESGSDEDEA